ncbi:glycosyltransferase family 87 protein [Oceaniglobus indicus]|uniref:glycosyltransferase family 87 protein n=1 Tax=Oceaniglobus indicus TaxID=2047749 RepID=UPI000C1A4D1B|nr:glycosyltransferase family 87 protein [Oceaniglobus indicus]
MAKPDLNVTDLVLLAGVGVLCVLTLLGDPPMADLLALWLAGQSLAEGVPHLVYPSETLFTIRPPLEWVPMAVAAGHDNQIFPFIYPPLTAAIMARVTEMMTFAGFTQIVHVMNVVLGVLTSWLAWRATGRVVRLSIFLFIGALIFHATIIGTIALDQGQPQILVAFLTVLAIERLHADDQVSAGALLAVAAAIKVFPVLFVVFLLARRQWAAVAGFAIVGAVLAGLSVALTGWPLHAAFLHQLSTISQTAIILPLTFSLDSLIGGFSGLEYFLVPQISVPSWGEDVGLIGVVAKGALWGALNKVALIGALGALGWAFARHGTVLLWPAAMIVLSLLSPLAWSHHFLAAVAFAPAVLPRWGAGSLIVIFAPLSIPVLTLPAVGDSMIGNLSLTGALAMALLAVAMVVRPAHLGSLTGRLRSQPAAVPRP